MTDNQINQLKGLKELLDSGVLSQEEFEKEKSRIIGTSTDKILKDTENPCFEEDTPTSSKKVLKIAVGIGSIVILGGLIFALSYNKSPQVENGIATDSVMVDTIDTMNITQPAVKKEVKQTAKTEEDARAYVASLGKDVKYVGRDYQDDDPDNGDYNRVFYLKNGHVYQHDFIENKTYDYKSEIESLGGKVATDAILHDYYLYIITKRSSNEYVVFKSSIAVVVDPEVIFICRRASFSVNGYGFVHVENPSFIKGSTPCPDCVEDYNLNNF